MTDAVEVFFEVKNEDKELQAIEICLKTLSHLDFEDTQRVLRYLMDRTLKDCKMGQVVQK